MALVIIKLMQLKSSKAGLEMSASVLKEELVDLKEVIMIYDNKTTKTTISRRSSIQQRLWDLFSLGIMEKELTIH